ncbi:MAG: ribonuclease G [Rhodocyclaceae bacterium]|nr:ribonuclease G [Rhodocyclaceae bacterium]MBL0076266.1 ribonuclease G [Rhodocyclaceae bacterium]MBP6108999.1 ribonuclease G [Rhodocyclaceae bacterium]MBP6279848.1 ribonuclease G [Rhodocyclaceae bacterium]
MPEQFLINFTPQETRIATMQHGVVQELHIERSSGRGIVGNVYMGKVVRVLPGMQSAFVEIGLERTAFLHVAEIWACKNNTDTRPIERILSEGQSLMVQVLKDPIGTKGARLTTQVSFAGRLLVHLPQERHIGISQRIENESERDNLRARIQTLAPEEDAGGFIVRTVAEGASDEELSGDIAYLRRLWQEILSRSRGVKAPALLHEDLDLAQRVLRDLVNRETQSIVVDSRETFHKLTAFAREYMPQVADRLEHYTGERPLFDLHNIEEEIQKALARRVDLKSGGYLIFDQTEAMTTVDVNTGGFVGVRNFDETIFKTNLEATQTIARQLRLRNLGGIIIVDFIDMDTQEHQSAVLAEFNKALSLDRTRVTVSGFTQLGLIELTRKRTRESLAHILCQPCPTCSGRGEVKTARTVCYEILREVLRESRQFSTREMRILAAPVVIDLFLDEESQALAMLSDFIERPVSLHAESGYNQEQFDIVLM